MRLFACHHVGNRLFQPVQRKFEHGNDSLDHADSARVVPIGLWHGIDPDCVGKRSAYPLQAVHAGSSAPLLHINGAVRDHQLVGSHTGVPDENEAGIGVGLCEVVQTDGLFSPRCIQPKRIVNRIVKKERPFEWSAEENLSGSSTLLGCSLAAMPLSWCHPKGFSARCQRWVRCFGQTCVKDTESHF